MKKYITLSVLVFLGLVSVQAYSEANEYIRLPESYRKQMLGYHNYAPQVEAVYGSIEPRVILNRAVPQQQVNKSIVKNKLRKPQYNIFGEELIGSNGEDLLVQQFAPIYSQNYYLPEVIYDVQASKQQHSIPIPQSELREPRFTIEPWLNNPNFRYAIDRVQPQVEGTHYSKLDNKLISRYVPDNSYIATPKRDAQMQTDEELFELFREIKHQQKEIDQIEEEVEPLEHKRHHSNHSHHHHHHHNKTEPTKNETTQNTTKDIIVPVGPEIPTNNSTVESTTAATETKAETKAETKEVETKTETKEEEVPKVENREEKTEKKQDKWWKNEQDYPFFTDFHSTH
ncbi:UNKNOWN [Stylonychia lemnae]|uniref:Uncharacterized protein n=1 Tax=Stylonychia lemnae TaxID=5949 RepID=A0A078BAX2_STYLE|nr:UNKNOWN [Stylonychia lemnae]|eukprot:CDW91534.1 UNKNOWN [Stylonychia lemnae]